MTNPVFTRGKIFLAVLIGAFASGAFAQLPTNVTAETFYNTAKVNLAADSVKQVDIQEVPGYPRHFYVMDLKGKIWGIFPDTTGYTGLQWLNYTGTNYKKVLLANFSSETAYSAEGEAGAYSIAFPPNFASTHKFYVYYYRKDSAWAVTTVAAKTHAGGCKNCPSTVGYDNFGNLAGVTTMDEYRIDTSGDITKPVTRLRQGIFKYNHLASIGGGTAKFGPDSMMYLTVSDYSASARDLTTFARKVLRIDLISTPPAGKQYAIPSTNPYVNDPDTTIKREIWAIGFRNPWTTAFDKDNGDLWLGDVDQSTYEELNLVVKKGNYAWDKGADLGANGDNAPAGNGFSGTCATGKVMPTGNKPADCTPYNDPAVAFPRSGGAVNLNCIILGTVFHGSTASPFYGRVIGGNIGASSGTNIAGGQLWSFKKGDANPAKIGDLTTLLSGADHRGMGSMSSGVDGTVYVSVLDWVDPKNRAYATTGGKFYELYRLTNPQLQAKSVSEIQTGVAIENARIIRKSNQPRLMVNLGFSSNEIAGKVYDLGGKLMSARKGTGVYYLKPQTEQQVQQPSH